MKSVSKAARAWLALSAAVAIVSCGGDDPVPEPVVDVVVMGSHQVTAGETLTLTASTTGATDTGYTWSSSNTAVATVADDGTVTGVAPGETDIVATGTDSEVAGEHPIVVVATIAEDPRVAITAPATSVLIGGTLQLGASTTGGTDSGYTWTTDADADDPIALVDETGLVSGRRAGELDDLGGDGDPIDVTPGGACRRRSTGTAWRGRH